ncbi:hypothetical protein [Limnochorda pilosa]|uniref:Uncharacterized protein n=1 Tax=Limnochorda pilosa TaxID=1555112 RepID=A0A0K2SLN6_LIMPI|nr:hypothetical protein [Limnochorda pilosa]BAS27729.1 hypothetical protein LIP_1888 [Limnochorda pilosa]
MRRALACALAAILWWLSLGISLAQEEPQEDGPRIRFVQVLVAGMTRRGDLVLLAVAQFDDGSWHVLAQVNGEVVGTPIPPDVLDEIRRSASGIDWNETIGPSSSSEREAA